MKKRGALVGNQRERIEEMSKKEIEREIGTKVKLVAFLWKEKEYADALVEHLILKYNWAFVSTDELDEDVEDADLILAEEGWFEEIRHRDDLWNRTIFLMEQNPCEDPLTRKEFPYLVWKYDGFIRVRQRIAEAMEALCGVDPAVEEEMPATFIMGAWNYKESDCWELANQLAEEIKRNVLFINLEKFTGEDMRSALELNYCLEDILYYVLDRLEMEGVDPVMSIRNLMDVRNGVCSLPRFRGYNPLLRLKDEQWKVLLPALCRASEAAAIFLWTGREELDHCPSFKGHTLRCIYIKPGDLSPVEGKRWKKMREWMEREGPSMIRSEVIMADSWAEAFETVAEYGRELA